MDLIQYFQNIYFLNDSNVHIFRLQTWFNTWQVANNYTNPMQIDTICPVINE